MKSRLCLRAPGAKHQTSCWQPCSRQTLSSGRFLAQNQPKTVDGTWEGFFWNSSPSWSLDSCNGSWCWPCWSKVIDKSTPIWICIVILFARDWCFDLVRYHTSALLLGFVVGIFLFMIFALSKPLRRMKCINWIMVIVIVSKQLISNVVGLI